MGDSSGGNSSNNKVTLSNVTLDGEYAINTVGRASGTASDNVFEAKNGTTIAGGVEVGVSTGSGDATNNRVSLGNPGTMNGAVVAGITTNGDAKNNQIVQTGGTVLGGSDPLNGYFGVLAGYADTGDVTGNTVTLTGVTVTKSVGAGLTSDGDASDNTITLTGGSSSSVHAGITNSGNASGNSVSLTDYRTGSVQVGDSGGGNSSNNKVTIRNGSVADSIHAGSGTKAFTNSIMMYAVDFSGTEILAGNADSESADNSISIYGGTIGDNATLMAGRADGSGGVARDNTLTLDGALELADTVRLIGGEAVDGTSTGNTLNLWLGKAIVVEEVNWFQNYSLLANADLKQTALITTSRVTNLAAARVEKLDIVGGRPGLKTGDEVVLISQASGTLAKNTVSGYQGLMLRHDYTLSTASGALTAQVERTTTNPHNKALGQLRVGGLVGLNQAADLASGQGLLRAASALGGGQSFFSAISASDTRTKTGSYIDTTGVNFMFGFARRFQCSDAGPMAALFLETGYNRHDSQNEFSNASSVRGDGNHRYFGGGVLGRWDKVFADLYLEGSLRVGYSRSSGQVKSYQTAEGIRNLPEYRLRGAYYGAHAGVGYDLPLSEEFSLDLFAKYFWSRMDGDDATIMGDCFRFDDVDSHRLRLGGRLAWKTDQATLYAGAAFEREFDGEAGGSARNYGHKLDALRTKGNTGLFEGGIELRPAVWNRRVSVDLGVTVNVGRREGVGAHTALKWDF